MLWTIRALLVIGLLCGLVPVLAAGDDKDKLVDNPQYAAWAKHQPGATATVSEKTTDSSDKSAIPDEKVITYTLLSVSPDKVVVRAVVVERELLGTVEAAPTKHTYPAKLKQSYVAVALPDLDAKKGEETITWKGKEIKCKTLYGSYKKDGEEVEFKAWLNDSIPGGVVKRTRTTKQDKAVITTTITLLSYKAGEKK
jgi:hypothetical protein